MKTAAFLLGSCFLMLVGFRNSVTWHLWKFWGASGYFWQTHWENLHRLLGGNEWIIFITGSFIIPTLVFWIFNGIFMIVDLTGKPNFITRHRIQKGKNDPVDREMLYTVISTVLFNQVFVTLPLTFLALPVLKWRYEPCSVELPTFQWTLSKLAVFPVFSEVIYYYFHRASHHPSVYKYVHKTHHEWTAPFSITGYYVHPVEMAVIHLMGVNFFSLLFGCHITLMTMLTIIVHLGNIAVHCGFRVPFLQMIEFHDFHHIKINQCFGQFGILDRLHGTDTLFRQRKAHERHHDPLNCTPLSESIPDSPKKLE